MTTSIKLNKMDRKSGVFSKGDKQGQPYTIGVAQYGDASGRTVSRITQKPDVTEAFIGDKLAGELKLLKTNPYKFNDATGKEVVANTKWCVVFAGESDEQAIFAHGRQPLGYVAKKAAISTPAADARP